MNTLHPSNRPPKPGHDSGQGLTEYLILIMLVAVISIGAVQGLGKEVRTKIETVKRNIRSGIVVNP